MHYGVKGIRKAAFLRLHSYYPVNQFTGSVEAFYKCLVIVDARRLVSLGGGGISDESVVKVVSLVKRHEQSIYAAAVRSHHVDSADAQARL